MKKSEREFVKRVKDHLESIDFIETLSKEMDTFIRKWIKKHPEDWERITTHKNKPSNK